MDFITKVFRWKNCSSKFNIKVIFKQKYYCIEKGPFLAGSDKKQGGTQPDPELYLIAGGLPKSLKQGAVLAITVLPMVVFQAKRPEKEMGARQAAHCSIYCP